MTRLAFHLLLIALLTLVVLGFSWRRTLFANFPTTPPLTPDQVRYGPTVSAEDLTIYAIRLPANVRIEATLSNAIDILRERTGQNIYVNRNALLLDEGIDRDADVVAEVGGLTFEAALDRILTQANGGHGGLGFKSEEGVITVSTKKDLMRNTLTRVYDLRSLLPPPGSSSYPAAAQALLSDTVRH
jgi:hypothetical protein